MSLKDLQNGSDIRGVAMEGVAGEPVNLTPETARRIASSFVTWLSHTTGKPAAGLSIAVGMDSRLSGPELKHAVIRGITSCGAGALDCGLASTPAMFMATRLPSFECSGAVMITASHLPFNRNGLKFFTSDGGLDKQDISGILRLAEDSNPVMAAEPGGIAVRDLIGEYSRFLADTVRKGVNHPKYPDKPLTGLRIVVDAGNGSGGFFAGRVLAQLGAETAGSRFLEPDGLFPNHAPNPEDPAAMESIREAVLESQADLGIIFDTDVDRAAAVDDTGEIINRNRLIALISCIVLAEHPGTAIVTDSITSDGLTKFIDETLHGNHHRFRRGYRNVINEALRLNREGTDCWLAIETSGHAALKENYFLDDGAYLVTKILITLAVMNMRGEHISGLTRSLPEPAESGEYRARILVPAFREYGQAVLDALKEFIPTVPGWEPAPVNHEGLRVCCGKDAGNGWFLLRMSLHDPVMPLNIESEEPGGCRKIAGLLEPFFRRFDGLSINLPA